MTLVAGRSAPSTSLHYSDHCQHSQGRLFVKQCWLLSCWMEGDGPYIILVYKNYLPSLKNKLSYILKVFKIYYKKILKCLDKRWRWSLTMNTEVRDGTDCPNCSQISVLQFAYFFGFINERRTSAIGSISDIFSELFNDAVIAKIIQRRWQKNKWVWSVGGMMLAGYNRNTRTKTCLRVTLSTTNPTCTALGLNKLSAARGWRMQESWQALRLQWHN